MAAEVSVQGGGSLPFCLPRRVLPSRSCASVRKPRPMPHLARTDARTSGFAFRLPAALPTSPGPRRFQLATLVFNLLFISSPL